MAACRFSAARVGGRICFGSYLLPLGSGAKDAFVFVLLLPDGLPELQSLLEARPQSLSERNTHFHRLTELFAALPMKGARFLDVKFRCFRRLRLRFELVFQTPRARVLAIDPRRAGD